MTHDIVVDGHDHRSKACHEFLPKKTKVTRPNASVTYTFKKFCD